MMWDFTKIFTNSDNLFKFLFVGGISMVFVAMFYPLKQQHELELKCNDFHLEKALLDIKIKELKSEVKELEQAFKQTNNALDSLGLLMKKSGNHNKIEISKTAINLEKEYNEALKQMQKKISDESIEKTKLEFNGKSLLILDDQIHTYRTYTAFLIGIGIILSLIGLAGWSWSTWLTEMLRKQQYLKNDMELKTTSNTASQSES